MEFPTAIFMRLGINPQVGLDGHNTMQKYVDFCNKNGFTWFSTDSLAKGMSQDKRKKFLKAIAEERTVHMYFVIGKVGNGFNEIAYKAEVVDIKSDPNGMTSPEPNFTPDIWRVIENKIWIKVKNLVVNDHNGLSVSDFIVESSGKGLTDSIANSQYHFGYIKRK